MDTLDRATAAILHAELQADPGRDSPGVDWYVGPFPLTSPAHAFRDGVILADGRKVCKVFLCEGDHWCVLASNFKHLEVE
jgi:hypothetical protein